MSSSQLPGLALPSTIDCPALPAPPSVTEFPADLFRAVQILVNKLPIKVTFQEVKGHQDDHVDFGLLDRPSQTNVEADCAAKAYLRRLIRLPHLPTIPMEIHSKGWCCWINNEKVTSDHSDLVQRKVAADRLRMFLGKKEGRLSMEAFDLVDWDANEDTFKDNV